MSDTNTTKQVVQVQLPVYSKEQVKDSYENLNKLFYIQNQNSPADFKDIFVSCVRKIQGAYFGTIGYASFNVRELDAMPSLVFSPAIFDYRPREFAPIKDVHETIYVVLHEVFHIMLEHHYRGLLYSQSHNLPINEKTKTAYNWAMDAHLNIYLKHVPKWCVTIDSIRSKGIKIESDKANFEQIMDAILQKAQENMQNGGSKKQKSAGKPQQGQGQGQGDPQEDPNGQPQGPGDITDEVNKMFDNVKDGHPVNDIEYEFTDADGNPIDPTQLTQRYQQASNTFKELMKESYRGIGSNPELKELLLTDVEIPIDFRRMLRKYVASVISEYSRKTNPNRLNKRQPFNYILRDSKSDMRIRVLVGIDVSGSMSDDDVAEIIDFLQLLHNMNKQYLEIYVQQFDDGLLGTPDRVTKDYNAKKMRKGCGGTSFEPWFDWAIGFDRQDYKIAMIFTDGCGESKFDNTHSYRNFQKIFWITNRKNETISVIDSDTEPTLSKKSYVLSREM